MASISTSPETGDINHSQSSCRPQMCTLTLSLALRRQSQIGSPHGGRRHFGGLLCFAYLHSPTGQGNSCSHSFPFNTLVDIHGRSPLAHRERERVRAQKDKGTTPLQTPYYLNDRKISIYQSRNCSYLLKDCPKQEQTRFFPLLIFVFTKDIYIFGNRLP